MAADQVQAGATRGLLLPLLLVVALGAAAGFGYGAIIGAPLRGVSGKPVADRASPEIAPTGNAADPIEPAGAADSRRLKEHVVSLDPVVVNIGGAGGRWLRLEGAVTFEQALKEGREPLMTQVAEDVAAYLRGSSIEQLESAAGLEFIRDDLTELVQLRTHRRARRFILKSLVVE